MSHTTGTSRSGGGGPGHPPKKIYWQNNINEDFDNINEEYKNGEKIKIL